MYYKSVGWNWIVYYHLILFPFQCFILNMQIPTTTTKDANHTQQTANPQREGEKKYKPNPLQPKLLIVIFTNIHMIGK